MRGLVPGNLWTAERRTAFSACAGRRQAKPRVWLRMFFSEEKNQKTFISAHADRYVIWPDGWENARDKSFLLLFFKKEVLS
jgi:hypothetical protein